MAMSMDSVRRDTYMAMPIESVRGYSYTWLCPWIVYVEMAAYGYGGKYT